MARFCLIAIGALLLGGSLPAADDWLGQKKWDEGLAEVALYEGKIMKYGVLRASTMDLITVREFFDPKKLVKTNPRDSKHAKTLLPILKTNLTRRHRTGVYEYVQMASVFVNRTNGVVEKFSCVSSEWCGNSHAVFENTPAAPRLRISSYMDNMGSAEVKDPAKDKAVFYDALIPWLRQNLDTIKPKQTLTVVQSLLSNKPSYARLATTITDVRNVSLVNGRPAEAAKPSTPGKSITLTIGKRVETFIFQLSGTRRLTRWDGEQGQYYQLRKIMWLDYWQRNKPGDEKILK